MNVDVLREEMHRSDLIHRHGISSATELVEWVEQRNSELSARSDGEWGTAASDRSKKGSPALERALVKAREHGFFLGLSWEWLQREKLSK